MSKKKKNKINNAITTDGDGEFDRIVNSTKNPSSSSIIPLWARHGGFYLIVGIWQFFFGPSRTKIPKYKDNRFKFVAEQLISTLPELSENANTLITTTSESLLSQHRTIENTEARRRLEKWACWTIIIYLLSVFVLVILNGLSRVVWPNIFKDAGFISDTVMYVILSTTTVNIIGLGIIVLKGHFPKEEKTRKVKQAQNNTESLLESSATHALIEDTGTDEPT